MTETQVINKITNFSKTLTDKSLGNLSSFGSKTSSKYLSMFETKSTKIISQTQNRIYTISPNITSDLKIAKADGIFSDAMSQIANLKSNVGNLFDFDFKSFASNMYETITTKISDFASNIADKIGGLTESIVSSIENAISNAVDSITNMVNNIIDSFTNALNKMYEDAVALVNNIIDKFKQTIDSIIEAGKTIVKTLNNFYERAKGQSSTSKYIQANKPSADGSSKPNPDALKGTPDDKILSKQLKSETQTTVKLVENPLAKLLGFTSSLIPKKEKKKIEEPKPTGDKAQYGKIQVKENKGGFVEISDETPGNVRKINQHPTGTYEAMLANGDKNTKTSNNKQDITVGDWNITTGKDKIEVVVGDQKIEIRKNKTDNIKGDENRNINGVQNNVITGAVADDFKSSYTGKIASDYSESVGGNRTEKTSGDLNEKVGGNHKETIGGGLTIHVSGNVNIISGGSATIASSGVIRINGSKIMLG